LTVKRHKHGRPHDFFQGWAMRGSEGRKSSSRVQGRAPGGMEAKPLEVGDITQNDA